MNKAVLHLENIGLVHSADIALGGVTVITGNNNTGKTTISKALYSYARTMSRLASDYQNDAIDYASRNLNRIAWRLETRSESPCECNKILDLLLSSRNKDKKSFVDVKKTIDSILAGDGCPDDFRNQLVELQQILSISMCDYAKFHYEDILDAEFPSGVSSLLSKGAKARISMKMKVGSNFLNVFTYTEGKTDLNLDVGVPIPSVSFIDDAYSFDSFRHVTVDNDEYNALHHRDFLCMQLARSTETISTFDKLAIKADLDELLAGFPKSACGCFRIEKGDYYYVEDGRAIKIANLATGSKFFVILQLLFESGQIGRDSLLILDEPEAHLNPEWINILAKLIVDMNERLGITTVITTQSLNLVLAFDALSSSDKRPLFYMAQHSDIEGMSDFNSVDDIRSVYKHLSSDYVATYKRRQSGDWV